MNRGRLFATIEHIERGLERPKKRRPGAAEHSSPLSTPPERAERPSRPMLTASPSALATAAKRARQTRPPTVVPAKDPKGGVKLTGRALKVTLVLDAAELGQIELPQGKAAPPLVITATAGRSRRRSRPSRCARCLATIAEHGADNVVVILQGKLAAGSVIAEAGLVAQVKGPKPPT